MNMWMIRAGRGAGHIEDFRDRSVVAIGWGGWGDLRGLRSREELIERAAQAMPDKSWSKQVNAASQIYRFLEKIRIGDSVITYDSGQRVYLLGTVQSDAQFDSSSNPDLPRFRKVEWKSEVPRDKLSSTTRNSLGAILTLFKVPDAAARDILAVASGQKESVPLPEDIDEVDESDLLDATRDQARESIKDRINALDGYQLQDLVAGVLRAMGYKTRVSTPGSDRGIDIAASPDGFGFEQPRIIVECKHRPGTAIGAQDIRTFLGGRHKDDKGLYVSTGGFTKEARYEAERASIPLTLMDLDQLVEAVTEHYEKVDSDTRVLLPLVKIYWPAG